MDSKIYKYRVEPRWGYDEISRLTLIKETKCFYFFEEAGQCKKFDTNSHYYDTFEKAQTGYLVCLDNSKKRLEDEISVNRELYLKILDLKEA